MPVLKKSSYNKRPWYMVNPHLETILPSIFLKVQEANYERERLELKDGDFLDLDWLKKGNKRLIILSHGLEGNSSRHYIMRPAKFFSERKWDVLAWNCRGCSGEINRLQRSYHHGDIEDISVVIEHALAIGYDEVSLIGFSMGGNMMLKYLGVNADTLDTRINKAIGFSVPCNLEDSSRKVANGSGRMYEKRFLRKLKAKIEVKAHKFPELNLNWEEIKDFHDFNEAFTMPVYGFTTEDEFHEQARSDVYFESIRIPTLVVNSLNDPMLGGRNFPYQYAEKAEKVWLETPDIGGHVGFTLHGDEYSWMEYRAEEWI
ncbi:MAG: alpha/beta fold hydrolase [Cytophagales bacterium]|nr:alpha/beta fold hydrolase [Cytophagales bacterium]